MACIISKKDNMKLMKSLPDNGIDFIYIDPPFFTDSDYFTNKKKKAYTDKWESMEAYLDFLEPRLREMQRLLKDTGLIAVHLDYHAVHYVKVLMDKIFGMDNFVNELIWAYKSGGASSRSFARKHDNILLYSKTGSYYFSVQKEKSYNRGLKAYHFKGVEEFQDETGWYTLVNRRDVLNIDMVGRTSAERTGYASQKPLALLEVLVKSCCPEDGVCADFFGGSGSLAVAAAKNGRQFIYSDNGKEAYKICKERLDKEGYKYEEN